jgi:hypothetical protein
METYSKCHSLIGEANRHPDNVMIPNGSDKKGLHKKYFKIRNHNIIVCLSFFSCNPSDFSLFVHHQNQQSGIKMHVLQQ